MPRHTCRRKIASLLSRILSACSRLTTRCVRSASTWACMAIQSSCSFKCILDLCAARSLSFWLRRSSSKLCLLARTPSCCANLSSTASKSQRFCSLRCRSCVACSSSFAENRNGATFLLSGSLLGFICKVPIEMCQLLLVYLSQFQYIQY